MPNQHAINTLLNFKPKIRNMYNNKTLWDGRFGSKVGQNGPPKLDKSGTFSDQISVHFGAAAPKCTEI